MMHQERFDSDEVIQQGWTLCMDRLITFKDWPKYLQPRPHALAMAGFIYVGKGDIVRCFSCHLTLNNWKPTDDPFVEHMKKNKDCVYLKSVYCDDGYPLPRGYDTCDVGQNK